VEHGIRISMSRRGNPYDNALADAFLKVLKYEEVYWQDYRDLVEPRAAIPRFFRTGVQRETIALRFGLSPTSGIRANTRADPRYLASAANS